MRCKLCNREMRYAFDICGKCYKSGKRTNFPGGKNTLRIHGEDCDCNKCCPVAEMVQEERKPFRGFLTWQEIEAIRKYVALKLREEGVRFTTQIQKIDRRRWFEELKTYCKGASEEVVYRQIEWEIWRRAKIPEVQATLVGPEIRPDFAKDGTMRINRRLRLDEMDMIPWWQGRQW